MSATILLAALAQYLEGWRPVRFIGSAGRTWPWSRSASSSGGAGGRARCSVATLVLLGEAGLAAYHVGIEQGGGHRRCIAVTAESVEELKRRLAEVRLRAIRSGFTFLGLTLAGWNLVASSPLRPTPRQALDVAPGAQTGSRRPNIDHRREESRATLRLA